MRFKCDVVKQFTIDLDSGWSILLSKKPKQDLASAEGNLLHKYC